MAQVRLNPPKPLALFTSMTFARPFSNSTSTLSHPSVVQLLAYFAGFHLRAKVKRTWSAHLPYDGIEPKTVSIFGELFARIDECVFVVCAACKYGFRAILTGGKNVEADFRPNRLISIFPVRKACTSECRIFRVPPCVYSIRGTRPEH